ncbi:MAG: tetratricopeptide repeat protein [Candidatus Omnitrophota bacterium]
MKNIILILVLGLSLFFRSYSVFAQEVAGLEKPKELTALEAQAREYRQEGLKAQDAGDLDVAMKIYQKAIEVDPFYAVAYNDLGVVYEAKGMIDRAEESYLKALKLDPYYLSSYTNLALLYEERREFGKAAYCWKKRSELGDFNDPWTKKAQKRFEDIRLSFSQNPVKDFEEQDILKLAKDISNEKYILRHDDRALARKHFDNAKSSYAKSNYAKAVKEALDAQYLDPENKDIMEFIEKVQHRALSE